jgi:hypothetical protein
MADERRLRIGPWVDNQWEAPENATVDVSTAAGNRPEHGDDAIEIPTTGVPSLFTHDLDDPDDDNEAYRGQRRAGGHPVTLRRLFAVSIMVGALLIGVGLMSRSMAPDPAMLLAPPPTPPELAQVEPTPATGTARLVPGPTGDAEPTVPAPAPAPSPDDNPPPGSGSGPTPPTPTTAPTTPPIASYEAEDANRGNHTEIVEVAGASGGRVVAFTTGSPNQATVEHPDVSAGAAGTYRLTIHYLTHTTRSVTLSVNGGPDTVVSLAPPGDAETVGTVTLSVHLVAGANTVLIRNGSGPGLRLDRISIAE